MKKTFFLLTLIFCLLSSGCSSTGSSVDEVVTISESNVVKSQEEAFSEEEQEDVSFQKEDATVFEETKTDEAIKETQITLSDIPEYSGKSSVSINNNIPFFTTEEKHRTDAFETYSPLDSLGRCGVAFANICREIQPTQERGSIGHVRPSGWHTVKYNDLIDGNYLYNRCHLIGYQLAGENDNTKNLITGTRYLNVEGMLPYENDVDVYVERTNNHVLYRVTPIYEGNNLVATGVLMEAYSVEDFGRGICFNTFCYNVQPGIIINYANGDSSINEETAENIQKASAPNSSSSSSNNKVDAPNQDIQGEDLVWVPNKGGTKYHNRESCSNMSNPSHIPLDEAKKRGYEPCKKCY